MIETKRQVDAAIERLLRRDPAVLARFIVSLARGAGPVGEQVRSFIVADDLGELEDSVRARLSSLPVVSEYDRRHAVGREIGEHLGYVLDSIESWVLPVDPALAFSLLVAFFEADGRAMEMCGEHHDDVQSEFKRASVLMAVAARSVPAEKKTGVVKRLVAEDHYGVRAGLVAIEKQIKDLG
jgi:hypothetical protein